MKNQDLREKYVDSLDWIRRELIELDGMADPVMGIKDWDDAVCIKFGNKTLIASTDGPYCNRLVVRSALIHASTDVVVKGGRPLFALDTVIGKKEDVQEIIASLKRQSKAMSIPILGGNTLFEDTEPRASITVVGELVIAAPIRDNGAKAGDLVVLVGEPLWGGQEERFIKAKRLFSAWYAALEAGVKFHSAKDVTKGGLVSVVYEMEKKCGRKFVIDCEPYSVTRNLDNFIVTLSKGEYERLEIICGEHNCRLELIGKVE